jgi:hypothetical protein
MITRDLFGYPVLESELPAHRDKLKRKETPNGYAAPPGTGPKGEYCRTCEHAVRRSGGRKHYWKCYLRVRTWSACYATDIRLKSPACRYWELHKLSPFRPKH